MKHAWMAALVGAATVWSAQPSPHDVKISAGVKGKWDAQLTLPRLAGGGALRKLAERELASEETARYQMFVSEAKKFYKKPEYESLAWSYEAGTEVKWNKPALLSFVVGCYQFEGGAHGIGVTRTYNFGIVGGKPKRLTLGDCLSGPSAKTEVQTKIIEKAMKTSGTDWIDEGMVTELTSEQLNRFWVSKAGLVFEFDPYELGSYAAGPFTFTLTWAELKPLLKRGGPVSSAAPS